MLNLTPEESRVLGVLIEKAQTTPEQYPLTLNALVNGANQKNNRDPVSNLDENAVFEAMEGLRGKGLVMRVDLAGSRVPKYRHLLSEKMQLNVRDTALLAELLLRGPQTLGELRGRASRMHDFETTEMVRSVLGGMMERAEPLVREVAAAPGERSGKYAQLLCLELHPLNAQTAAPAAPSTPGAPSLSERVIALESQVSKLTAVLRELATKLGEESTL